MRAFQKNKAVLIYLALRDGKTKVAQCQIVFISFFIEIEGLKPIMIAK